MVVLNTFTDPFADSTKSKPVSKPGMLKLIKKEVKKESVWKENSAKENRQIIIVKKTYKQAMGL